ncbi:MAG: hypothetical protein HYY84_08070 [Deltaproteobacteria bacterium]|nr:hypothetical protein [Deltaproteobacteria bacterium]
MFQPSCTKVDASTQTRNTIESARADVTARLEQIKALAQAARTTPLGRDPDLRSLNPQLDPKRDLFAQANALTSMGDSRSTFEFLYAVPHTVWTSIYKTEKFLEYLTPTNHKFSPPNDTAEAARIAEDYRRMLGAKWIVIVTDKSHSPGQPHQGQYKAGRYIGRV